MAPGACVSAPQGPARPSRPRDGRQQSESFRSSVCTCCRGHCWAPDRTSRPPPHPRPGDPRPTCLLDLRGCLSEGRRRAGSGTAKLRKAGRLWSPRPSPPLSLGPSTLQGAEDPRRWVWHRGQRSLRPGPAPQRAVSTHTLLPQLAPERVPPGLPGALSACPHSCCVSLSPPLFLKPALPQARKPVRSQV